MEQCVGLKLARHIGVSNYTAAQLMDLLNYCSVKPICNQIEVHLLFQNQQLVSFCQSQCVAVTAYSPLGGKYDYGTNAGKSLFSN